MTTTIDQNRNDASLIFGTNWIVIGNKLDPTDAQEILQMENQSWSIRLLWHIQTPYAPNSCRDTAADYLENRRTNALVSERTDSDKFDIVKTVYLDNLTNLIP